MTTVNRGVDVHGEAWSAGGRPQPVLENGLKTQADASPNNQRRRPEQIPFPNPN